MGYIITVTAHVCELSKLVVLSFCLSISVDSFCVRTAFVASHQQENGVITLIVQTVMYFKNIC